MSQRTYSYADPVLAGKLSSLADQFVNGPARAQQMQAQRQQMEAQAQLANQQRLAAEFEMDNVRGVQHLFGQNNPASVNELMGFAYGAGDRGNDIGSLARAFMLNNPSTTDDQRLAAFAGAGGNVNTDTSFSTAGQDRISARNSQEDIARTVAGIRATPLTESQVKAQILSGMPLDQQRNVVGGFSLAPGHGQYNALGDVIAQAPYSPSQQNTGGSSSVFNWINPETGEMGAATTLDGIPPGAVRAGNADIPSGGAGVLSPLDMLRRQQYEQGVQGAMGMRFEGTNMSPEVAHAIRSRAVDRLWSGESTNVADAIEQSIVDTGVQQSKGGIGATLGGLFMGGVPGAVSASKGWRLPDAQPTVVEDMAPAPVQAPATPQASDLAGSVSQQPVDAGPRPANMSDQDLIAYAQEAIDDGRDPEMIVRMLQAWGVDVNLSSATMGQ